MKPLYMICLVACSGLFMPACNQGPYREVEIRMEVAQPPRPKRMARFKLVPTPIPTGAMSPRPTP